MPFLNPKQKKLFEQLSIDRRQNADVLEKQSMQGVKLRVIEKYSDSAHFIYELLQNADDVKARTARFVLNKSGIIFAHNGTIHFSITDSAREDIDTQNQRLGHINAITSIGNSNKYAAQIGKFGVGFKAVFQYTNTPEIYDPPFMLKIERFIVPILLSTDHPDRQADETLFYLPFDNPLQSPAHAFLAILAKLKNLVNPLLFLRHLLEITWVASDGSQGKYTKVVNPIKVGDNGSSLSQKLGVDQITTQKNDKYHIQNFLVFTNKTNRKIFSIAYLTRLSLRQQPTNILSNHSFPAYCFFPTKETTQLRFIIQAPFLLTDSREGIKHGAAWNQHLIEALAQLTADSLSIIKDIGLLTADFFNVLPINGADFAADWIEKPIYDAVLKQLQSDKALLPTQAGGYTIRNKAYLAENSELMNLLSSEQLSYLVKNEAAQWVFPQITHHHRLLWDYVKHNLVNQEITSDKLVRRITERFIQKQSDDWLIRFYTYLLEKARYVWKSKPDLLKTKPILRLTDGQVVSAYNRAGKIQVYLPTENESSYPTIKHCLAEKSLQFLVALGLDKPKAYEEIKYYILPRYKQEGEITPAVMLKDFTKLFSYFLNCPWHKKAEYLNQLKNIPFCRARYIADNSTVCTLPSAIYFETDTLKDYFSYATNINFLDNDFYAPIEPTYGKKQLNNFFKELGVADKPRRIKIKAALSSQQRETIHQGKCTYDYYHFFQYTYDYDIEGLDAFIARMNLEKSQMLWHFLLKLIMDNLGCEIFKGQYNWFYRRERYYYFDAKFLTTLRHTAWLYNHSGLVKPADIIVPELETDYETNSYAAKILIEKLAIQPERLTNFTEAQRNRLAFGDEVFKLATKTGIEPTSVLQKFKYFLTQSVNNKNCRSHTRKSNKNPLAPHSSSQPSFDTNSGFNHDADTSNSSVLPHYTREQVQLEQQFKQKIAELTTIEELKARLDKIKKYSFAWFNILLELEYLLSENRKHTGISIKFNRVEKGSTSDKIIILKNPSRYLPQSIEDTADLSLQLYYGTEMKSFLIEVINVKESTLLAHLKSAITGIDLSRVQSAIIEIKNPSFVLEKLKTAFRQLPCVADYNLQTNLTSRIEFIFGPPGTGKTTYLATEKIIPLLQPAVNLKMLVLTPTNKVADVLVRKIMAGFRLGETGNLNERILENWLIRFGVTGDSEIENTGILKERAFDITHLPKYAVITTIARFLYDGFAAGLLKDLHWDIIVFDEASMIMLAQMAYVLYQQSNCHFIVGGDPLQIQPVVITEEWKMENIYTLVGLNSFQSPQTVPHKFHITNLTTQYRSIPPLGTLVSQFSYNGNLKHHRKLANKKMVKLDSFELKEITIIKFPVRQENLYRSQRLEGGGTYHIYSAIFTVELVLYLSRQINQHSAWKIGIVCPYLAQATLVEKMLTALFPANSPVQIMVGTVHSFQGDEFDIILNLLNPPPTISSNIFLNNRNILNVAISRAKDYLILLIPAIDGLEQITRLATILKRNEIKPYFQELTAFDMEKIMFNQSNYIYENSLFTPHQKINVYGKPTKKYEVRYDNSVVDIQINAHFFSN